MLGAGLSLSSPFPQTGTTGPNDAQTEYVHAGQASRERQEWYQGMGLFCRQVSDDYDRTAGGALLASIGGAAGRCWSVVGQGCSITGRDSNFLTGSFVGLGGAPLMTCFNAGGGSFFTGSGVCGATGFAICSAW
jgi:hypothetical protein